MMQPCPWCGIAGGSPGYPYLEAELVGLDPSIDGNFATVRFCEPSQDEVRHVAPPGWSAIRSGVPKRDKSQAKAARKARKRQRRGW